jgi:hypothetical protein
MPEAEGPMILLESICLLIVLLYLVLMAPRQSPRENFLRRLFLLSLAGIVAENTCIYWYGFYQYCSEWSIFVGVLPLMVGIIWPIVIHAAWNLARRIVGAGHPWVPWLSAFIVLADASLIEPIAVASGLWSWNEPGLFHVPLIGILGWSFFTFWCVYGFEACDRFVNQRQAPWWLDVWVPIVALVLVHLSLLLSWWGLFRWINTEVASGPVVFWLWVLSLLLALLCRVLKLSRKIPRVEIVARLPGALFFFGLLWLNAREQHDLFWYALAFVPPYAALTLPSKE